MSRLLPASSSRPGDAPAVARDPRDIFSQYLGRSATWPTMRLNGHQPAMKAVEWMPREMVEEWGRAIACRYERERHAAKKKWCEDMQDARHGREVEAARVAWTRERQEAVEQARLDERQQPGMHDECQQQARRLQQEVTDLQRQLSDLQAQLNAHAQLLKSCAEAAKEARRYRDLWLDARGTFQTYCRIRPPVVVSDPTTATCPAAAPGFSVARDQHDMRHRLIVHGKDRERDETFTLDRVFLPDATASDIYLELAHVVSSAVTQGHHVTVVAYGRSGTGKSTTINGLLDSLSATLFPSSTDEGTLRLCHTELYASSLYDLLSPSPPSNKKPLPAAKLPLSRTTTIPKIIVPASLPGINLVPLTSPSHLSTTLAFSSSRRRTSPTAINALSSRSHAFITLLPPKHGSLSLIDLAGHEDTRRLAGPDTDTDIPLAESRGINAGLTALSTALAKLAERRALVEAGDRKGVGVVSAQGTWGETGELLPRIVGGLVERGGREVGDGRRGNKRVVLFGTVDLMGDRGGSLVTLGDLGRAVGKME